MVVPGIRRLTAGALLLLATSCYVEVTSSSDASDVGTAELASTLEREFARKAGGATARIECGSGLTGQPDHGLRCKGETSDGWTLDIAVRERGGGKFRWEVVESERIR